MAIELAEAYVQIVPSTKGIKGKLTSLMDGEATTAGQSSGAKFSSAFGGFIGGAAKVTAAAVGAAAAGIGALTTQAVQGYGRYEQLIGGVDKLYGTASAKVQEFAANAYKSSGMSANAYMESATSFSAALISSLEGDVDKAAELTDVAMRAMSDNVNVFGSDMGSVEHAFQGFAKQNYVMLDNLKLGYGGTKTEMQRLIKDASQMTDVQKQLGLTVDESSMSFANIVSAIQVMQTSMGIAGTTQKEAAGTIEGSLVSVQAAWDNLVTGLANDQADFSQLVENLVNSIVGEDGGGFLNNIIPRIQQAMEGIGQLIVQLAPVIGQQIPVMIDSLLPSLVSAVSSLVSSLASALPGLLTSLLSVLPNLINTCIDVLLSNLPALGEVALQAIVTLANGLTQSLPTMIPQLVEVVMAIVDTLIANVDLLVDASVALIMALAQGLITATPKLVAKAPEIVLQLQTACIRNAPKMLKAATELIMMLITGIANTWSKLFSTGAQIVEKIKSGINIQNALQWGRDLIDNFISGIKSKIGSVKDAVKGIADTVKSYIGFSEPEEGPLSNFHTYAPDMMKLFAQGIKDNEDIIGKQLNESLSLPPVTNNVTAVGGNAGNSVNATLNIYGADGQNVNELADIVMDKINTLVYKQGAVYA